jgi:hypothetical protein
MPTGLEDSCGATSPDWGGQADRLQLVHTFSFMPLLSQRV